MMILTGIDNDADDDVNDGDDDDNGDDDNDDDDNDGDTDDDNDDDHLKWAQMLAWLNLVPHIVDHTMSRPRGVSLNDDF